MLIHQLHLHVKLHYTSVVTPQLNINEQRNYISIVPKAGYKGWNSRSVSRIFFVFAISQLIQQRNLKILVSNPHNYQKTKKYARDVYAVPPFVYPSGKHLNKSGHKVAQMKGKKPKLYMLKSKEHILIQLMQTKTKPIAMNYSLKCCILIVTAQHNFHVQWHCILAVKAQLKLHSK